MGLNQSRSDTKIESISANTKHEPNYVNVVDMPLDKWESLESLHLVKPTITDFGAFRCQNYNCHGVMICNPNDVTQTVYSCKTIHGISVCRWAETHFNGTNQSSIFADSTTSDSHN